MKDIIKKYRIHHVWHFTDESNIELIRAHGGVLSLSEVSNRNIVIPSPGGNEWSHKADKAKGIDRYVHLAFIKDHPMLFQAKSDGRIKKPVWLKIKSSILLKEGVKFSSDVANKAGVEVLSSEEAENAIDFDVLFTYMDWHDANVQQRRSLAKKAEILVPKIVPIEYIESEEHG
ncbi:MAG: DUF4433 domain-containing protein [Leptolyngbya sp. SIO1E4]|nr:DUF4433 domain-containing protein [Leptolyngbya sp. SIO1E4]